MQIVPCRERPWIYVREFCAPNQYFINHNSSFVAAVEMSEEKPDLIRKQSYTIPCASSFRSAVGELAARRGGNVADLARSVVLVVPLPVIAAFPDPGGPGADDRETVVLKSGRTKGQLLRRKPRLQVRLSPGQDIVTLRRALGLALALDKGDVAIRLSGGGLESRQPPDPQAERAEKQAKLNRDEIERLRAIVSVLSFDPLAEGIRTRNDALHILGFAPGSHPDQKTLKARFRTLAAIHHPDGALGNHDRMSQLNEAMDRLRRG